MLYIFHGPDDFSRAERLTALKEALGDPATAEMNLTVLEGRSTTLADIRAGADAMPFLAPRRLVIVHNYLDQKKEALQPLLDYLPHLSPSTDLVFSDDKSLNKSHPVLKLAAGLEAEVIDFGQLAAQNLRPWIANRVQQHGASIEGEAIARLAQRVGPNLRLLHHEIEKLSLYVDNQRPITPADVDLLVPYIEEAEQFGMANAIGKRNARLAYDQLHKELDDGKHPLLIMGSIAAQMRALLEVKDMAARRMSPADIARAKGWKSDYAARMRLREAHNFSLDRLEDILEILLDLDLAIKTGRIDGLLALDVLIARLCTGR